jgi:hypothetical protein
VQFVCDGALLWAAVWGIELVETDLAVIGKVPLLVFSWRP